MTQVVVSPKYQVVIPREVREKLSLQKGQKMTVMAKGNIIVFMPVAPLKHYRGFLKGMNAQGIREKKDRV
ncbi:MAG: AbrB/MazE/SpoVT family DNA-binding domain-containing protein [Candidatus Omnitrophica bacterium]|nr:AbrB/MazE/SpoVT family DNA-binding domain-containing protein [Candidatus Omnitrophota bacterium]